MLPALCWSYSVTGDIIMGAIEPTAEYFEVKIMSVSGNNFKNIALNLMSLSWTLSQSGMNNALVIHNILKLTEI